MEISDKKMLQAETAIEKLADALDVTTADIIKYLQHGFVEETNGVLTMKQLYFIDEMKATFDCY